LSNLNGVIFKLTIKINRHDISVYFQFIAHLLMGFFRKKLVYPQEAPKPENSVDTLPGGYKEM
jgi:hypothetical protein